MRHYVHAMRIAGALALGLSLAGCESLENLFDTKKPLPGERKPVFSEGVPGVPQGVPPELVRGYRAPPEPQQPAVVVTPAEKPKAKPAPRATTVAVPTRAPATSITVQPSSNVPPPSSWPTPPAAQQTQQPPQQQAPQQATQQSAPQPPSWPGTSSAPGGAQVPTLWPSAPPPDTFSR